MTLKTFWQFSRPHTIIGSVLSVTALYIIATGGAAFKESLLLYVLTLTAALGCNIFITGINQIADVEIDKINKPYLPLASGALSTKQAKTITGVSLLISIVTAFAASFFYGVLIITILLIGIAYSLPPLYLKQHHLPAAVAITLVRGFLVNVGIFLHYNSTLYHNWHVPGYIWCLTIFIMAFSVAIAWFKDLPDTEGDAKFKVKTLSVLYSKRIALAGGTILTGAAYVYVLAWSSLFAQKNAAFLIIAHSVLLVMFLINFFSVKLKDKLSIKKFYLRFWVFFFAEYLVFAIWALL